MKDVCIRQYSLGLPTYLLPGRNFSRPLKQLWTQISLILACIVKESRENKHCLRLLIQNTQKDSKNYGKNRCKVGKGFQEGCEQEDTAGSHRVPSAGQSSGRY